MKIVFVSDGIFPYHKGGKEKRLFELSTRLAKLGHDVHIYTMHWWETPEKTRTEHGVQLHALSRYYEFYHGERRSIKEGIMFGAACLRLFRVQFDVLDVDHMPFFPILSAWLVCMLSGRRRKFYGTWHESLSIDDWVSYMGRSGYIASLIERICIRLPYRITAASERTKYLLARQHQRTRGVSLVASGIDTHALRAVQPANADCDVLYVGRLVKDKNVDKLIQAMAIVVKAVPQAHCVIVGSGVEEPRLAHLIEELGLTNNVTIVGHLPDSRDVYAYMKRAKVFVLPSAREGFGIVALEALGCGTPVITVNSPANATYYLVKRGANGTIVPLTAQSLAIAIKGWISRPKPHNIAEKVSNYDWDNLTKMQEEVYAL